jgi:hypothetical protein
MTRPPSDRVALQDAHHQADNLAPRSALLNRETGLQGVRRGTHDLQALGRPPPQSVRPLTSPGGGPVSVDDALATLVVSERRR